MTSILVLALAVLSFSAAAQSNPAVLRAAIDQEPTSLNPYYTVQQAAYTFIDLYLLRPWLFTRELQYTPVLVEALPPDVEGGVTQNEAGQTVVRYTLRADALWSDGTPVTAADFIFPFEVANDGVSAFAVTTFGAVASVEQGETEREVVVTFNSVNPDWFNAGWWPLPEHALREPYNAAIAADAGLNTLDWSLLPTIGNGPFVPVEWQQGSFMRFARSETFAPQPYFEEVVVSFFPDTTVLRTIVENGEADIVHNFQAGDVIPLLENDNLVIDSQYDSGREAWWFNLGREPHPAITDVRVRRAIAMGIDRQLIVDELLGGLTTVPHSFWSDTPYFNEAIEVIGYDPEGAMALLDEAGWIDADGDGVREASGVEGVEDGLPLSLTVGTTNTPIRIDAVTAAQDMLDEIGVEIELVTYESANWATPFTDGGGFRGGFDDLLHFYGFTAFTSIRPTNWFACNQIPSAENPNGINVTHACYPELDELWNALATTTDLAEREAIADEIQVFMAENVIWIGLWNRPQLTVYSTDLQNVTIGAQSPYISIAEWTRAE
jgi:peptide/nickel transport system substrate-binding protein